MQAYLTLVRRELGGFFLSLTGYVIIASVLLLLGVSFSNLLAGLNGSATNLPLTELFYSTGYFWFIFVLAPPVMTMRTFAAEKASGTYETLMTTPVSDWQVVLAKFTGSLVFYLITWLPLLLCIALVRYFSREATVFDPRTTSSTFLGLVLIGCLYISMGCFASALTRSQIIAAMTSFALGLGLFLLSWRSLEPTPGSDWVSQVFLYISTGDHLGDFARGIIDTRQVVFYLSVSFFFLFLTHKVVESRRWK